MATPPPTGIKGPWGPFPETAPTGPGGGVASVTGAAPGIVNNTDPANPVVEAQFGSDTTVQLPNAGSTLVDALELVATLVSNTVGAEVSQWAMKLLKAGAQVTSYIFGTDALTVPGGGIIFPDAGTNASIGVPTPQALRFTVGDFGGGVMDLGTAGALLLNPSMGWRWPSGLGYLCAADESMCILGNTLTNQDDVQIGNTRLNDVTDTRGYLSIPSCAGAPTGIPANQPVGKVQVVYDRTNSKIYVYDGVAWKSTAALT